MHNVMIVDDERLIREGLSKLIDWEAEGYRITALAKDGFDALAQIEKARPDLAILDIRMPEMDGMQLLQAMREKCPRLKFIFLSGHAEFEYAHKALKLGVENYLLKPIEESELIDALRNIGKTLTAARDREILGEDDPQKKRLRFLESALGGMGLNDAEIDELASRCGLNWNTYQVLLLDTGGAFKQPDIAAMRSMLQNFFEPRDAAIVFPAEPHIGLLLKHANQKQYAVEQLHKELLTALKTTEPNFRASLGKAVFHPHEIPESLSSAKALMEEIFFVDPGKILYQSGAAQPIASDFPWTGLGEWVEKLSLSIDSRNLDAVQRQLKLLRHALKSSNLGEKTIKAECADLLSEIVERFVSTHPESRSIRQDLGRWLIGVLHCMHFGELFDLLERTLSSLIDRNNAQNPDALVKSMMELIEHNYQENLRLESLASVFNYSSAYLGKLFKAKTGEYFNTYLDKVRIRKAIEFLSQGMKVYQVSELVGYSYVDYFHRKFRKYTGHSPSSYHPNSYVSPEKVG